MRDALALLGVLAACLAPTSGLRVPMGRSVAMPHHAARATAQLGPRPRYLVDDMDESALKYALQQCLDDPAVDFAPHDFSIGHRGACLQFPEHTEESYIAAMEMGAGIVECDVAVTKDGELVCRHAQVPPPSSLPVG